MNVVVGKDLHNCLFSLSFLQYPPRHIRFQTTSMFGWWCGALQCNVYLRSRLSVGLSVGGVLLCWCTRTSLPPIYFIRVFHHARRCFCKRNRIAPRKRREGDGLEIWETANEKGNRRPSHPKSITTFGGGSSWKPPRRFRWVMRWWRVYLSTTTQPCSIAPLGCVAAVWSWRVHWFFTAREKILPWS